MSGPVIPKALFFDVFGTLVDWRTSIAREAHAILEPRGFALDWLAFADAWRAEYQPAMEEIRSAYYLRVMVQDRPGVLSQVAGALGRHEISIASVMQKERHHVAAVPVVMMTHEAVERNMRAALEEIDRLPVVAGRTVMLRVEAR